MLLQIKHVTFVKHVKVKILCHQFDYAKRAEADSCCAADVGIAWIGGLIIYLVPLTMFT